MTRTPCNKSYTECQKRGLCQINRDRWNDCFHGSSCSFYSPHTSLEKDLSWPRSSPGARHESCCQFMRVKRDPKVADEKQKAPVCILREVDALYELIHCEPDVRGWNSSEPRIHVQDLAPCQRPRQRIELHNTLIVTAVALHAKARGHGIPHTDTYLS